MQTTGIASAVAILMPVVLLSVAILMLVLPTVARPSKAQPGGKGSASCAHTRLRQGLQVPCHNRACVFSDVIVSATLPAGWLRVGDGQAAKAIISPRRAFPLKRQCVAYGGGISNDWSFEASLVEHCQVHAFDCTIRDSEGAMAASGVHFSPVCIGETADMPGDLYKQQLKQAQETPARDCFAAP